MSRLLKSRKYNFLLFYGMCESGDLAYDAFLKASQIIKGRVGIYYTNISISSDLANYFNISYIPSIYIFNRDKYHSRYNGPWNVDEIVKFSQNLIQPNVTILNNSWDVASFQMQLQNNLIISDQNQVSKASSFLFYDFNVGIIQNQTLAKQFDIPNVQFRQSKINDVTNFTTINQEIIARILDNPKHYEIQNCEIISKPNTYRQFLALFDSRDYFQHYQLARVFSFIEDAFDDQVSLHYLDIFKCPSISMTYNFQSDKLPMFVVHNPQKSNMDTSLFPPVFLSRYTLISWVQSFFQLTGLKLDCYSIPSQKRDFTLPETTDIAKALNFFTMFSYDIPLSPKDKIEFRNAKKWEHDVFIFTGLPHMKGYLEIEALFYAVQDIFGDLDRFLFGHTDPELMENLKVALNNDSFDYSHLNLTVPCFLFFPKALNGKNITIMPSSLEEISEKIVNKATVKFTKEEKQLIWARLRGERVPLSTLSNTAKNEPNDDSDNDEWELI